MGCALAIDHGEKRTGFAVADALRISSRPLDVFHGAGDQSGLLDHAAKLVDELGATTLVVGLPLNMDGSEGPRAKAVLRFVESLRARCPRTAIATQDERLSSAEADALLVEAGYTGDKRKARRDSWSALVILRDWIEAGEPGV